GDEARPRVLSSDSILSESHLYHAKSEGHSRPLSHRKSDSYAAPAAQRRSAGAGISDPEGGGPSPGCRSQAFPVRPPRRDGDPDRLPPWTTRQRTLRVDLEYDRA